MQQTGQGHRPRLAWGYGSPTHLLKDLLSLPLPPSCLLLQSLSASSHLKKPSRDSIPPPCPVPCSHLTARVVYTRLSACTWLFASAPASEPLLPHCHCHYSEESPLTNVPRDLQDPVSTLFSTFTLNYSNNPLIHLHTHVGHRLYFSRDNHHYEFEFGGYVVLKKYLQI